LHFVYKNNTKSSPCQGKNPFFPQKMAKIKDDFSLPLLCAAQGFATAVATRGLCARPLDSFAFRI
jgi:hypothetical protein